MTLTKKTEFIFGQFGVSIGPTILYRVSSPKRYNSPVVLVDLSKFFRTRDSDNSVL